MIFWQQYRTNSDAEESVWRVELGGNSAVVAELDRRIANIRIGKSTYFLYPPEIIINMQIFLVGVSCVGKSTIGPKLAALLGRPFYDLDDEIERYFAMPIERLQDKLGSMHSFRKKAAKALKHLLDQQESWNSVIALPPSGLMESYGRLVKKSKGLVVVLTDEAENILDRIIFFDKDSKLIQKNLTRKERSYYLREIKKDISYFNRSYKKADVTVHLYGLKPDQAVVRVKVSLENHLRKMMIDVR